MMLNKKIIYNNLSIEEKLKKMNLIPDTIAKNMKYEENNNIIVYKAKCSFKKDAKISYQKKQK